MKSYVYITHDVTIDGQGHTVTRASGFEAVSDTGRSWYNPALFELHPDAQNVTATFKSITINETSSMRDRPTSSKGRARTPATT